jgi:hypothetical protein
MVAGINKVMDALSGGEVTALRKKLKEMSGANEVLVRKNESLSRDRMLAERKASEEALEKMVLSLYCNHRDFNAISSETQLSIPKIKRILKKNNIILSK